MKINKNTSPQLPEVFNDIATDKEGKVYVSEMSKQVVLTVGKDSLEVFAASDQLSNMNGVSWFQLLTTTR